ncbi:MAG: HAD family hydrolase, partial [Pirellulales bacterium]
MYVCLFDIDGTLIKSGGAGRAAMEAALRCAFGVSEPIDDVPFTGRTDRAITHDLFRRHGITESPENWQRFLRAYVEQLPETLPRYRGQVLPGIAALLEQLAERRDVAVGLLTGNVRAGARLKLGHYGLAHHFRFGGFGDEHVN